MMNIECWKLEICLIWLCCVCVCSFYFIFKIEILHSQKTEWYTHTPTTSKHSECCDEKKIFFSHTWWSYTHTRIMNWEFCSVLCLFSCCCCCCRCSTSVVHHCSLFVYNFGYSVFFFTWKLIRLNSIEFNLIKKKEKKNLQMNDRCQWMWIEWMNVWMNEWASWLNKITNESWSKSLKNR